MYSRTQLYLHLVLQENYNNYMFWPCMWAILDFQISYTGMCGALLRSTGGRGGGGSRFIIMVGAMAPGCLQVEYH